MFEFAVSAEHCTSERHTHTHTPAKRRARTLWARRKQQKGRASSADCGSRWTLLGHALVARAGHLIVGGLAVRISEGMCSRCGGGLGHAHPEDLHADIITATWPRADSACAAHGVSVHSVCVCVCLEYVLGSNTGCLWRLDQHGTHSAPLGRPHTRSTLDARRTHCGHAFCHEVIAGAR